MKNNIFLLGNLSVLILFGVIFYSKKKENYNTYNTYDNKNLLKKVKIVENDIENSMYIWTKILANIKQKMEENQF